MTDDIKTLREFIKDASGLYVGERNELHAALDRLNARIVELEKVADNDSACIAALTHGLNERNVENDHLRAKLERAERYAALANRRENTSRKFWIRDAKEALAGKPQALRNRIELFESPENNMRVVLSELSADAPAQQKEPPE